MKIIQKKADKIILLKNNGSSEPFKSDYLEKLIDDRYDCIILLFRTNAMIKKNKKAYEEIETFNFKLSQSKEYDIFSDPISLPLTIFSKDMMNTKRKEPNFLISGESIQNTLEDQNLPIPNQGNSSFRKFDNKQKYVLYK